MEPSPLLEGAAAAALSLPTYAETRGSGVEWLGDVPAHWEVRRLRSIVDLRLSNVDKHVRENEQPVRLCNYMDVYGNDRILPDIAFMPATATVAEIERFRLRRNDVLITKDSEDWKDIGIPALAGLRSAENDILCGYHCALLRPRQGLEGAYLFWFLHSSAGADQFRPRANGVTRYGLAKGAIGAIRLPLPPLAEQAPIVRFLDYVDQRIRRYIRDKEELMALLEEQKQAVIHQTVTGQIDARTRRPYPVYRKSGLDWLPEVPAHWRLRRNGRLFAERQETGFGDLPVLEVSLRTGVQTRDLEDGSRKQQMTDRDKYKRAAKGDIAYNMMRLWQGAVGIVPLDGLVSPAYVVARPLPGVEVAYYDHLFRTDDYKQQVNRNSRGIVSDRNRLYWDAFKRMASPCPPLEEQKRIVKYLQTASDRIDAGVDAAHRQIALLQELRMRLTADVVTGKLDVRKAAASLPVVDPSETEESQSEGPPSGAPANSPPRECGCPAPAEHRP